MNKPAGEKAARVLVTIPPTLLAAADAYAQRSGISRAELIRRAMF
jgi:metal-responsive CopG/Arc/MetJ family transcriptional regulator